MKRYGITSAELAVADTDAFKAAKAIILKKSDIVANAEEVNGIGLKELVASSTDEIANRMRWQSQFFKDFYANNQRLTNRRLVVDEDDFVWYAGKDGKLSTRQTTWRKDELGKRDQLSSENPIKGVVSYVDEKKIQGKLGEKITIGAINNEDIVTKGRDDKFNNEVWAGKDYKTGNALMEYIIDDEHTVTVKPGYKPETTSEGSARLKSDGTPGKGFDSVVSMNFRYESDGITVESHDADRIEGLTRIKKEKVKPGSLFTYGHELIHALHNQMGINEQNRVYYEYLDSTREKHRTGDRHVYVKLLNSNGTKKSEEEILSQVIYKLKNPEEFIRKKESKEAYDKAAMELEGLKGEKYDLVIKQIRDKLNSADKDKEGIEIFVPIFLIKQEEFNTVGNPKMFENSKIIHKFPDFPTERGLEKENNFDRRAVYDGVAR